MRTIEYGLRTIEYASRTTEYMPGTVENELGTAEYVPRTRSTGANSDRERTLVDRRNQ